MYCIRFGRNEHTGFFDCQENGSYDKNDNNMAEDVMQAAVRRRWKHCEKIYEQNIIHF